MVQMAFFLRFRSQLQRLRPELIPRLEDSVVRTVKESGGKVTGDRSLTQAVFDENSLGFWLDILLLIESLTQTLEEAASDLSGYSLLVGKILPGTPNPLCRFLSSGKGGVFLDKAAVEALRPYITIDEQGKWTEAVNKYGVGPFARLKEIKIFVPTAKLEFPLSKTNAALTEPGQRPAALAASQSFEGKRDKLYLRVAGFTNSGDSEEFSPLFVRFGSGGLNALTDSWAGWMHSISAEEEICAAWDFLFRQRLRERPSPFAIRTSIRFFKLLINAYRNLAQAGGKTPVIIIENIQNAEQAAAEIVIDVLRGSQNFLLLGTCTGELTDGDMAKWKPLFPQLTRINTEEPESQKLPELPFDLWEIGYACFLFGQYFPPDLLPRLFEEAGKSSRMISRAFSLLYTLRVIDTPLDPRPWQKHFQYRAETVLGERSGGIRAMVRSRLLAWVEQRKINPCLRLLEILKKLNGTEHIDDSLILRAINCELACADGVALESARYSGVLEAIGGPARAPILLYLVETMLALHSGKLQAIHAAFANQPPDCSSFPLLKAQVLLNQSLYHIGLRDNEATAEAVKEASMLCQGNSNVCLAQAYRLSALTSLSRQRIGETIDYIGFSLENAAKSGIFQDIGMAAYYAASVQLLFGNLSRSRILAEKARRHFLKAGNPEWADRSRFLLGRLAFEIGSYQEALEQFEDILENPEGADSAEKNALLEAWACRTRVYRKTYQASQIYRPPFQDIRHDASLFEIEAQCLTENYSKAVELYSANSAAVPASDEFLCIERPDWSSGFAQCELLFFSWDDLRDRMASAYNSIAQSRLFTADDEEATHAMQRVLRGGQFPEIDPNDVFYHYAWYRVLKQTGASQVDISTAVSVAFKRLQSRAGRIDDMETRRQYLTQPLWNKALEQAARDFKLI
ncbi:MAG: tetratricopeptide repeat protein [Treponema sp.]|jgi:hypothetical protein|nr:tetratricopeptide repeat protein [Treponema sp.]